MPLPVLLESLIHDLRFAARGFAHNPMFTLTAVFAAALGIGATTAVFSVVDRILFRSLPYAHDEQLVSVGMMAPLDTNEFLLPDAYFDWRKHQTPFTSITSFTAGVADCDLTEANPVRLGCGSVEGNFLPTFGLSPVVGRNFTAEEDRPNGPKVALISCGLWQGRFGHDPNITGKTILIDGQPITILGVLPPTFEMPQGGTAPDLLLPEALNEATERTGRFLRVFARLKPGVTLAQSHAALQPLFEDSLKYVPLQFRKEVHLRVRSLRDRRIQDARTASWVLLGAVAAVLLIACANIANLLLARSAGRRKELAVRAALGAGRGRLIRQTLTESALLSLLGGIAGCALAWGLLRLFAGIAPHAASLSDAGIDGRVLFFALGASLVSGLLFGIAPAIENPPADSLTGTRTIGGRRMLLRESLVATQIAVSLVLLSGAGMLLRSLWKLENEPLGMQPERVVTAEFVLGRQRYADDARQLQFYNDLERRIGGIPGVASFTLSDSLPPVGGVRGRLMASMQVEGLAPFSEGTGGMIPWRYVTPGYFATLGIPIIRGRGFSGQDRAAPDGVMVLSETLARKFFPNGHAVGKRIKIDTWANVIGVAADVRGRGPMWGIEPEYYVLRRQALDTSTNNRSPVTQAGRQAKVAIRTSVNPKIMSEWIRKEFAALDPTLPVTVGTMQQRVNGLLERPRFNALLLALFAGMGVLLAAIGLYGVMAFLVGQRTQEIGIRMALGATPGSISKLVLSRAAAWTLTGAVLGLVGSLFATRALRTLLFQTPERDPWTFAVALPCLAAVALAAAWIPSRRASRVDPMTALRHE